MFAIVSLKSFVYDIIDVFSFPDEKVRAVYNQYDIENVFFTLTWLIQTVVCSLDCDVKESRFRKIMFEIKKKSKIPKRLDCTDDFWKQFGIYDENTKS